jgi:hypothetical protein
MILNSYLYYINRGVTIDVEKVNSLIELAKEHISTVESEGENA